MVIEMTCSQMLKQIVMHLNNELSASICKIQLLYLEYNCAFHVCERIPFEINICITISFILEVKFLEKFNHLKSLRVLLWNQSL